jgi:hypothetical protein
MALSLSSANQSLMSIILCSQVYAIAFLMTKARVNGRDRAEVSLIRLELTSAYEWYSDIPYPPSGAVLSGNLKISFLSGFSTRPRHSSTRPPPTNHLRSPHAISRKYHFPFVLDHAILHHGATTPSRNRASAYRYRRLVADSASPEDFLVCLRD